MSGRVDVRKTTPAALQNTGLVAMTPARTLPIAMSTKPARALRYRHGLAGSSARCFTFQAIQQPATMPKVTLSS